MKREEENRREEKLQAREISVSPTPYKRPERQHGKLYRWFDNFWYHHKWATIATLFITFVVVVCVVQMCSREEEGDVSIVMAGPYGFTAEESGDLPLRQCLATYLPADYNENGKKDVTIVSYPIYSEDEIKEVEGRVDEKGEPIGVTIDRYTNSQNYQHFFSYLQTGSASVIFASPFLFEELSARGGVLADLGAIVGEGIAGGIRKTVSDGSARVVGVRLGDTALWRENSAIRDKLPEDTVICLMMPTVLGDANDDSYQHAIDYVKALLK